MSLLMDALRKAEADKKQALTADPGVAIEQFATGEAAADVATRELRHAGDRELAEPRAGAAMSSATVPKSAGDDLEGVELSLEPLELNDGAVEAAVRLPSVAGDTGTPRIASSITATLTTAQTVFDAGPGGASKRAMVWGAVAVIGCGLAGAGIYYLQQAPKAVRIPSPSVAAEVESLRPKALPIVELEPARQSMPEAIVTIEPVIESGIEDTAGALSAMAGPPAPADDLTSSPSAAEPLTPTGAGGAPASPRLGIRPGEVRIARSDSAGGTGAELNQAYAAYVGGDYARAEELYQRVLSRRPEQRDALLGIAALKLRDGNLAQAHRLYRQVIKRDPGNPTANAALFSIESGAGDQVTESRLKMLLDEGVNAGYIFFTLGNLYARHHRWADAQQAYFEALRNHPTNPDYNYNLAVSLDRIGQRQAAAKYYGAALTLTDVQGVGFDTALALARIHAINSAAAR